MNKIFKTISFLIAMTVFSMVAQTALAAPTNTYCTNPVTIASYRGCEPTIETRGVVSTTQYSAIVQLFYSSNGADYNYADAPSVSIEFGLLDSNQFTQFPWTSKPYQIKKGTYTQSIALGGTDQGMILEEGKTYQYRAVMNWVGGATKYGEIKTFVAKKQITPVATPVVTTTTTTNTTAPATTTANTTVVAAPKAPATGIFSVFGTTAATNTTDNSRFKNVDERSGFRLAIDDGETQVHQGDTVTIKVRYENNTAKSYNDGVIEIYLPDQYTLESTSKGIHDKVDNSVVISLRDFPAGGFGTAIVSAKATGKAGDLDQAISQASMKVAGLTFKVSDVDEYVGGSGSSVLGASASGTSFLPGSLIGWFVLLIVLAGIVLIGRRYFVKKDY